MTTASVGSGSIPQTLAGLIRWRGEVTGDLPAFTFEGREISYRKLDALASQAAQGMLDAGVRAGDRVAILDKNVPEMFVLLVGAVKIGAVLVAVNWRLSPQEIAFIVGDAEAKVLAVGAEFVETVASIIGELDAVGRVFVIAAEGVAPEVPESWQDWDDWIGGFPPDDPGFEPTADDLAFQFYTSGTTGLPKGAMLTNANLFSLVPVVSDLLGMDRRSVSMVAMPLFHVAGAGWAVFGLVNGAHNVMLREVDLPAILEAIPTYAITHAVFVPAVLQFLLSVPGVEDVDFSSLEMIVYGASPISTDVLERSLACFGCGFAQAYGLTETDGAVVVLAPEDHDPGGPHAHRLRSAGQPLPGVELRIVGPEGADLPVGELGEVWIKSPSNMLGYWRQPDATADALREGWFTSGDAGYLDADGYLYISDRVKDMIITGGENVYPAEVESVLMAHPEVADAAVIGVPDERWGEAVKAVVVPAPDAAPKADDLIAWCRERLAHYKCPTSVDWSELLPRNPTGKILKRDLREPYWADRTRRV